MTWHDSVLDKLGNKYAAGETFSIEDVYELEKTMKAMYPNNRHVRETLRDLMQQYRDEGLVRFDYDGNYLILEELKEGKRRARRDGSKEKASS